MSEFRSFHRFACHLRRQTPQNGNEGTQPFIMVNLRTNRTLRKCKDTLVNGFWSWSFTCPSPTGNRDFRLHQA